MYPSFKFTNNHFNQKKKKKQPPTGLLLEPSCPLFSRITHDKLEIPQLRARAKSEEAEIAERKGAEFSK